MSKHTPGPWFAVGGWVEVEDDNVADICTCHPDDVSQGHLGRTDAEVMANARLIAAAPDLLEALLMMFESIHPYREDGTPTIPDETVAKANAAIAKATGAAE